MDVKMQIQSTPNPNALKFVLSVPVKTAENATFKNQQETLGVPLALELFNVPHVKEVYFFDNYITVTQDGEGDWDTLEEQVKGSIMKNIEWHDPNFKTLVTQAPKPQLNKSPEIIKIESILDETVRPALQADGGDLQILGYDNNILTIHYQGACGSCPSSSMGTMKAIENILKESYNPEIVVQMGYQGNDD